MKKSSSLFTLLFLFLIFSCSEKHRSEIIDLSQWRFNTGDHAEWSQPGFDDSGWKPIKTGTAWEYQGWPGYDGYAWYRIKFNLPSSLKDGVELKDSLLIALGMIDRDQTFLNGQLLGENATVVLPGGKSSLSDLSKSEGRFTTDRNYTISANDPRLLWDKENVLAIRIFDVGSVGGLMSSPLKVRVKDKTDYLAFDAESGPRKINPNGTVTETIILKNNYAGSPVKGKLTTELKDAEDRVVVTESRDLKIKDETPVELTFKGDTTLREKITCTFVEDQTGNTAVFKHERDCSGGWAKYPGSPVLGGGSLGMMFDVSLLKDDAGTYLMYSSWGSKGAIGLSESKDGLTWSSPVVCLGNNQASGWENSVNRPVVILKDGVYHLWYTGQVWHHDSTGKWWGNSWIGYATSTDRKTFKKLSNRPVISPELPWEKTAVMCPHVIWDGKEKLFKMWYSGGEQLEPDAIGYATSKDGLHWTKFANNPVFTCNPKKTWEQHKVTACQVIKREKDYLMFYIGFKNIDYAQIGMARSKDGITNWERYSQNPIIKPGAGWDAEATYKPFVVPDSANNRWLLYYNGRLEWLERIGVAVHDGMDFGF